MFLWQVKKGENEFWQYLVTISMTFFASMIIGALPLVGVGMYMASKNDVPDDQFNEFVEKMNFEAIGMDQNLGLVLLILSFAFGLLALWWGVKYLHKRDFKTVITARSRLDWGRIFWAFGVWMAISFGIELISYLIDSENYIWQFQPGKFLILLLIALLLLPIQTSFEEIFIRGYLLQGLGLLFTMRWVPVIITSIIFGAMHIMNPEVREFGVGTMMIYYIGIAIFLCVITLLDEGLELALGIHAATNIYGATMMTFESSALQTPALFRMVEVDAQFMSLAALVMAGVFYFFANRKYGLNDWSKVLGRYDLKKEEKV